LFAANEESGIVPPTPAQGDAGGNEGGGIPPAEPVEKVQTSIRLTMTSARLGIIIGALLSAGFYFLYIAVLHEPGSAFYGFAALVFLGCPLIAGIISISKTQKHRQKRFFASSGLVFGITLLLFILTYAVVPQFERTTVQLPTTCDGFAGVPGTTPSEKPVLPSRLAYALPDRKVVILLAESPESVVAVTIDGDSPPFASTAYLIRKSDNAILREMRFDNDVVIASIDAGTLYIYNDKLGYLIDERTGKFEDTILLIDNYGGLSETDRPIISRASSGSWYLETTAVVSSWNTDGTVKSRPHLNMNGIARGCYVSGAMGDVIPLAPRR